VEHWEDSFQSFFCGSLPELFTKAEADATITTSFPEIVQLLDNFCIPLRDVDLVMSACAVLAYQFTANLFTQPTRSPPSKASSDRFNYSIALLSDLRKSHALLQLPSRTFRARSPHEAEATNEIARFGTPQCPKGPVKRRIFGVRFGFLLFEHG